MYKQIKRDTQQAETGIQQVETDKDGHPGLAEWLKCTAPTSKHEALNSNPSTTKINK
jgi:hypothetical protein